MAIKTLGLVVFETFECPALCPLRHFQCHILTDEQINLVSHVYE